MIKNVQTEDDAVGINFVPVNKFIGLEKVYQ